VLVIVCMYKFRRINDRWVVCKDEERVAECNLGNFEMVPKISERGNIFLSASIALVVTWQPWSGPTDRNALQWICGGACNAADAAPEHAAATQP
jgi:hypothetical protein